MTLAGATHRTPPGSALALLFAVVAAGCSRTRPPPSGNDGGPDACPPVASMGEARVTKAELCDFLYARFREPWVRGLDLLLDERLAALEAARLGVSVPAPALDRAVEAETSARAAQAAQAGGDLASAVRAAYGLEVDAWRRDVLRPRVEARLLLERVVRRCARARDQVVVRVIVVADPGRARELALAHARGADFGLLALQESRDASRASGGLLPPIARGDLARRDLEEQLFAAPPGAIVGPVEVAGPRGPEAHVYKVVERTPPWAGDPARLSAVLEADLVKNPLGRSEYERWAARARRDHGVRVFAPDGTPLPAPE